MSKEIDSQTSASVHEDLEETNIQAEPVTSPWPGPVGMIPVTSGKADDANVINRKYLDSITVKMRIIDAVKPDLTTNFFGKKYTSPITLAAVSHLNKVLDDPKRLPMQEKVRAATNLGVLNWIGMESDEDYRQIVKEGGDNIRIVKPFLDHERIIKELQLAEELGAVAVGMDLDHVPGVNGDYDVVDGLKLGPVSTNDLSKYVQATNLPFVAKGILSVEDAIKAKIAGASAIVVSHHHGRLPFGVPPLKVLPEIKQALADSKMTIFVDGSLMSGYDAYKALAMGADGVLVGRAILKELLNDGQAKTEAKIRRLNQELKTHNHLIRVY